MNARINYHIASEMLDFVLGVIPVVSTAKEIFESVTDKNVVSGKKLSQVEN